MGMFRDFILGQPLNKKDEQPEENKKIEPEENKKKICGDISPDVFEKIISGGKDGVGHYKIFGHGDYSQHEKRLESKLKEIIEARKKEQRTFNKDSARQLASKLNSESDPVSRLLAKAIMEALKD